MKKILFLGGSTQQIPVLKYAKRQNYYIILCDYLIDNPGQKFADKYYCESTTDIEKILKISEQEDIDAIVAYASDPAAPTAAYVAETLKLYSNPFKSVEILADKAKFRKFLYNNNFNCPKTEELSSIVELKSKYKEFELPFLIKPVDSSGSKGVKIIHDYEDLNRIEDFYNEAMKISRKKTLIIEEYIERYDKFLIGGDIFVLEGQIVFWGLMNCHRDSNVNELVPVGKSFPSILKDEQRTKAKTALDRVFKLLNIKFGAFNIELIFNEKQDVYLIEVGPRNGGNMIPDLIKMATNVDLIESTVETALGNTNINMKIEEDNYYHSSYNLHSSKTGIFKGIKFSNYINEKIVNIIYYKKYGDEVDYFDSANKAIGICFLRFTNYSEMINTMENFESHIDVQVD